MRLRSIRYKDGRAPVRVLHNAKADPADNPQGAIRRYATTMTEMSVDGSYLEGFLLIGMFSDRTTSTSYCVPSTIPPELLTAYLTEVIRRDIITGNEARGVFDSMFEWADQ